ncbi:hypothetical protein D0Z07_5956 [Hyphodiscus hymeniophilus]|uniref:Rhodopsin domain-containing protein n=1 Tax=Hyphodiscus hymeniophilus TaxID=353542 RepID=A0A9P6VH71_9HELO|nr:hypothetical protein D0Z07_5956 [Hyphodiscus hymeniophilus]
MALGGRGYQVVGLAYVFLVLSTISIFLRCYVRLRIVNSFGIDDVSAVIAWALFMINLAFAVTAAYHGVGQHASALPPAEIPMGLKVSTVSRYMGGCADKVVQWWFFCEPIFVLASMAIKFSIGIYLVRIAQKRAHRWVLWTAIVVMEVFSFFFFFLFIFQCTPSNYFWTQLTGGKGSCINLDTLVDITYTYSAIACATDWLYAIMPMLILWDVEMNIRTKVSVAILIGMGASASIATVIRIPYLKNFRNKPDFLFATTDVMIWTTVELGIGICAASLATIRPLLRKFIGGISTARSDGTTSALSWANPYRKGPGYVRSVSRNDVEEYELRHHVGASFHIEPDRETQAYSEKEVVRDEPNHPTIPTASLPHLKGRDTVGYQSKDNIGEREKSWREHGIVNSTVHCPESRATP